MDKNKVLLYIKDKDILVFNRARLRATYQRKSFSEYIAGLIREDFQKNPSNLPDNELLPKSQHDL